MVLVDVIPGRCRTDRIVALIGGKR